MLVQPGIQKTRQDYCSERFFEVLAGIEFHILFFGDGDSFSCSGISPFSGFSFYHFEASKPGKSNTFSSSQRILNSLYHGTEGLFCLEKGDPRFLGHLAGNFFFVQIHLL